LRESRVMRPIAVSMQDEPASRRRRGLQAIMVRRLWILTLWALWGCTMLPPAPSLPVQISLDPATSGDLANVYREAVVALPEDESAFLRLSSNESALNWRLELIDRATTSIDLQYFIWNNDVAANLFFLRLLDAADRGVRVRLMVDDIFLIGRDRDLAILGDHPYLNIKIYNPGRVRDSTLGAIGEFLLNFRQLNRRMHNKMLVADNRIGIIGGRNIGNAYFGLDEKYNFRDLDVLVTGPVVEEISHAFDEYWNHEVAYPVEAIPHEASPERIAQLRDRAETLVQKHLGELASFRAERPVAPERIERLVGQMQSGEAHFLQDDPVSVDGEEMRIVDMLMFISGQITEEMIIITPYFIPRPTMLEALAGLTSRGVSVQILTGSLGGRHRTLRVPPSALASPARTSRHGTRHFGIHLTSYESHRDRSKDVFRGLPESRPESHRDQHGERSLHRIRAILWRALRTGREHDGTGKCLAGLSRRKGSDALDLGRRHPHVPARAQHVAARPGFLLPLDSGRRAAVSGAGQRRFQSVLTETGVDSCYNKPQPAGSKGTR